MAWASRLAKLGAMVALGVGVSGCAYVGQHHDGSVGVVGLAAVNISPGPVPGVVNVRSHGVTLSDAPPAQGLVLGVLDKQMDMRPRGSQFAPASDAPAGLHSGRRHGNIDFVERTRLRSGDTGAESPRVHKRYKYRAKRKYRSRWR